MSNPATTAVPALESSPARAPRLTSNRLSDIDVAVEVLEIEIAYLAEAITQWEKDHPVRGRLETKRARLVRACEWIAGKIAAERAKRGDTCAGATS